MALGGGGGGTGGGSGARGQLLAAAGALFLDFTVRIHLAVHLALIHLSICALYLSRRFILKKQYMGNIYERRIQKFGKVNFGMGS